MAILLGCIADDFTGATDLANTLVKHGMRTTQVIGVPDAEIGPGDAEAVVVALKSRTIRAEHAVAESLTAMDWLRNQGARQIFFKYCSTFDSTPDGNIGPVADALLDALHADFSIACPAFPANGRSVYQGHLFVGDRLLSDSGMEQHPLTPMNDPDLVRVLGQQTTRTVGLVPFSIVSQGWKAITAAFDALRETGHRYGVVDAISDDDLWQIGTACKDLSLITGGSGVALGLPENFRRLGLLGQATPAQPPTAAGARAVLAGSCSRQTQLQVQIARQAWPSLALDPLQLAENPGRVDEILEWAGAHLGETPVLIYSTADPEQVRAIQQRLGRNNAGSLIEDNMGRIAQGLRQAGVRELIVAGGETSGAVVKALGIRALRIGPEIDPGVPWCQTEGEPALALALKSGNFGADDFFAKAFGMLT